MKSDLSRIPTPMLRAFRVLGVEPVEPTVPRRVCAWCQTEIAPGVEPASHGICPTCQARVRAEHASLTQELHATLPDDATYQRYVDQYCARWHDADDPCTGLLRAMAASLPASLLHAVFGERLYHVGYPVPAPTGGDLCPICGEADAGCRCPESDPNGGTDVAE